jgi:tetratricopeptide (TPR) repeat protein
MLGLVYQGVGMYKEAEEYIQKAIRLQPNQTFAVAELTKLYIIQKQFDKAKSFLEKLYKEKPDNRHVLSSLGDVYLFSGDYKTAKKYYLKELALFYMMRQFINHN